MPFFQPAAQAHQVKRHPALDVRGPHDSPGAGSGNTHMYYNNEFYHDHNGPALPPTDTPVPATVNANAQASSTGDIPTPSNVTGGSTSIATPGELLPSNQVLSSIPSSSSPLSPSSTLATTAVASSTALQSTNYGSTTMPLSSPTPTESAESALAGVSRNSSRPSGGLIAAIVIVLLLALCAVAFFVFRRYRIQRRVARRVTWTTNHPFDVTLEKGVDHDLSVSSDARIETGNQLLKEGGNGQVKPVPQVRNIARKPPLPYSPVSPIAPSPSQSQISNHDARAPSMDSASVSTVPSTPVPDIPALVRMAFVIQLPDELVITPGETLYIRSRFDDGWALCVNSSGKQGMVPLECLEGGGGQFAGHSNLGNMRRASSLNSAAATV